MSGAGGPLPFDRGSSTLARQLARRGYGIVYRENETNYCPGCGRTHWYIGRLSAECGFCGTAVPLPSVDMGGNMFRLIPAKDAA